MKQYQENRLLRGRLTGAQINRMRKLLDMKYRPRELAEEIGINVRQFYRVYIPAGCPHEREGKRTIWINGKEFRKWVERIYKKRKMGEKQGFCRTCDRGVDLVNPVMRTTNNGDTDYLLGTCPNCGRKIPRFIANRRGQR